MLWIILINNVCFRTIYILFRNNSYEISLSTTMLSFSEITRTWSLWVRLCCSISSYFNPSYSSISFTLIFDIIRIGMCWWDCSSTKYRYPCCCFLFFSFFFFFFFSIFRYFPRPTLSSMVRRNLWLTSMSFVGRSLHARTHRRIPTSMSLHVLRHWSLDGEWTRRWRGQRHTEKLGQMRFLFIVRRVMPPRSWSSAACGRTGNTSFKSIFILYLWSR